MRESVEVSVEYYTDERGRKPFIDWMKSLDPAAAETILYAVYKRRNGNTGNSSPVRGGIHELKAKGFRVYYGVHGDKLIILLGGGTKRRQQADIDVAVARWRDFKQEPGKRGKVK